MEWGDPAPDGNAQARAQCYGYSDRAIANCQFSLPPLPAAPEGRAHPDSRSVRRDVTTCRAERRTTPGRRGDASRVAPADHTAARPAPTGTDLRQENS
ncbi:hypothetical protein ACFV0C_00460 [Streptomyces sp. NPDC059568]|uniref:hypothetical protein n=1 Tax=Streptomyces sp. NPDC059568 TaxID=3346868 RepID=UPI0036784600